MKTLKRIFGYTMALAVGFGVASCADENDWDVDGSHDRLFGVANDGLNVTEGDTWAEVEFSGFRGTEYYIIEVSTDSLTDDIGMGESAGSIVFGEDRSITTSPDTIRGLLGETKYYLRMKLCQHSRLSRGGFTLTTAMAVPRSRPWQNKSSTLRPLPTKVTRTCA